jgi:hypothetical protein
MGTAHHLRNRMLLPHCLYVSHRAAHAHTHTNTLLWRVLLCCTDAQDAQRQLQEEQRVNAALTGSLLEHAGRLSHRYAALSDEHDTLLQRCVGWLPPGLCMLRCVAFVYGSVCARAGGHMPQLFFRFASRSRRRCCCCHRCSAWHCRYRQLAGVHDGMAGKLKEAHEALYELQTAAQATPPTKRRERRELLERAAEAEQVRRGTAAAAAVGVTAAAMCQ